MWVQIAIIVISMIISYVTAPKSQGNQAAAATMDDFDFPQAEEGTPQMVIFGDSWCSDWTVIGLGNFSAQPITKSGGGKK